MCESIAKVKKEVRYLQLGRNSGQTAAMQAGFDHVQGKYIATLDGDLQNDPKDILRLLNRLKEEKLDLIVGWRKDRKDPFLRSLISKMANSLIGWSTDIKLHDYGCSLKVYRNKTLKAVQLYGEMHRLIPAWMSLYTDKARISEEVVNHRPRIAGESKYGFGRIARVPLDLFSIIFFQRFLSKPAHFFGFPGLVFLVIGIIILFVLSAQKIMLGIDLGDRPLFYGGMLSVVFGTQLLTTGLLAEVVVRIYFSNKNRPYVIRRDSEN
jgi:glycosyltransferase involved in cell wall biosynthesis